MNWREFDFRHDWISLTLHALKSGFEIIRERAKEETWFDGIWQLEHRENIVGIAFVAAQAYMLGTVEDINKIRAGKGNPPVGKINCYSDDPNPLPSGRSRILLINAIANYYKHHDEWDAWPTNLTVNTLADVGIVENTEFPCYEAATKLWDADDTENLENLLSIITEWREHIISTYK
jgi:hypothetical protein